VGIRLNAEQSATLNWCYRSTGFNLAYAAAHPSERTSACSSTVCVAFSCISIGWKPEETTLGFAFRWNKLKGRILETWANPGVYISSTGRTATDVLISYVEVPLDTPMNAIAPAVETVVRELFVQFGGYQLPTKAIEDWTRKLIERRL